MPIERVDHYDVDTLRNNPDKLYVFGDNMERRGRGGQAVIRNEPNALGVVTKRAPSMSEAAFFSDKLPEVRVMLDDLLVIIEELRQGATVVFPKDGLGTGRAQLKERAPITARLLRGFIEMMEEQYGNGA